MICPEAAELRRQAASDENGRAALLYGPGMQAVDGFRFSRNSGESLRQRNIRVSCPVYIEQTGVRPDGR